MPRSCGLMRPSAATAVASVITSAAPPTARLPKWTRCQSFEKPSRLEYSHMGETTMRFASVRERIVNESKRCGMACHCRRNRETGAGASRARVRGAAASVRAYGRDRTLAHTVGICRHRVRAHGARRRDMGVAGLLLVREWTLHFTDDSSDRHTERKQTRIAGFPAQSTAPCGPSGATLEELMN